MGLLEDAAVWLDKQREQSLSVTIQYQPQNGAAIQLTAAVGRTLFRAENEYGITVRTESRDFLVSTEQLAADPRSGDRIVFNGHCYEVLAPNGEPVWRWTGASMRTRRIHTKERGTVHE